MKNISRIMKHMYDTKLIAMRDGNISFKPANKNFFYITPGSVRKKFVEEDLKSFLVVILNQKNHYILSIIF